MPDRMRLTSAFYRSEQSAYGFWHSSCGEKPPVFIELQARPAERLEKIAG
jgi:hypothetical protein